jgi:hypothetical protein
MYLQLFNKYGDIPPEMALPSIEHLRIIGKAGIGKSTYIKTNFKENYILTSFTCISASQINGQTLSSYFKLGATNDNSIGKSIGIIRNNKTILAKIREAEGLVVDEFYTVSADIMDKVDVICQRIRNNQQYFGGLKLILVGDDRQTEAIENPFIESTLYNSLNITEIMLPEHDKMRLSVEYMKFCDLFRNPKLNKNKIFRLLQNEMFAKQEFPLYDNTFTVYYTNEEVRTRNNQEMEKLATPVIYNNFKAGCPIYITKNLEKSALCNGMIGSLMAYDALTKEYTIVVDSIVHKAKNIKFDMGFAMTVHKCQSKTFDNINIYIKKKDIIKDRSKYIRLLYVALTRVHNFNNCYICLE